MNTEPIGFKGSSDNWSVGTLLDTYATLKWSEEDRRRARITESLTVFANFTATDQGRSRKRVATCETPEDALLIAASKKMAVALQMVMMQTTNGLCEMTPNLSDFIEQTLKEAGL